jgi:DNA mismatch repair protein MutL
MAVLHRRYVLLESEDGLVLLDPVAARERIAYEAMRAAGARRVESQRLLVPVLVEADPRDAELLQRHAGALAEAGVELSGFGGRTVQVSALPACIKVRDPQKFVDELLHDLAEGTRVSFAPEVMAKALARRAGVGEVADLAQTPRLLAELLACELPYCAPDGRPTLSEISLAEIDRRFRNG